MPFASLEDRVHAALPQKFGAVITFGELAGLVGGRAHLDDALRSLAYNRIVSFHDPAPHPLYDALIIHRNVCLLPTQFYLFDDSAETAHALGICLGTELLQELRIPEERAHITVDARSGYLYISDKTATESVYPLTPKEWVRAH